MENSSDSGSSSSSGESLNEFHLNILQAGDVLGYQFEPRRDSNGNSGESSADIEDERMSIDNEERLGNFDWCLCEHCQIMDREEECAAWLQYKQEYGSRADEGPEHKGFRQVAYRQLVRWCWGVIEKKIRVVLPSCAVSCTRAHYPPPGDEDDFVFVGFHFPDE
ncbi:uncharacterized protein LOC114541678 [Dendronephthya gigantea]|uniref:uncharacterized protein LOC114541678 n=1 Tax=Dendronephthya gigantea TaxID=151771 RepID=UPI0010696580|nr:uncharacterized protein LOC114541678 [Dendronephthya gigantea]